MNQGALSSFLLEIEHSGAILCKALCASGCHKEVRAILSGNSPRAHYWAYATAVMVAKKPFFSTTIASTKVLFSINLVWLFDMLHYTINGHILQ